jgi:DNA-binding LytR/AlgR family response regulator
MIVARYPNAPITINESLIQLNEKLEIENCYVFVDQDFFVANSNYAQWFFLKRKTYKLIMVSETVCHALECIRFGFFDYFTINKLNEDFESFCNRINSNISDEFHSNTKKHILIKDHKAITKVQFTDILFIEAYGSYTNLYTNNKFYTISKTIKSIIPNFPKTFVSVHRSYAVNLDHVISFNKDEVLMNNETKIKISRAKKSALIEAIQRTA